MIQLVASFLTCGAMAFIVVSQIALWRNIAKTAESYQTVLDGLIASGRKMGEGWVEVARAVDAQEKRIALMEQRLINLEGRRWTVHNGGRPSDPEGGGTAA